MPILLKPTSEFEFIRPSPLLGTGQISVQPGNAKRDIGPVPKIARRLRFIYNQTATAELTALRVVCYYGCRYSGTTNPAASLIIASRKKPVNSIINATSRSLRYTLFIPLLGIAALWVFPRNVNAQSSSSFDLSGGSISVGNPGDSSSGVLGISRGVVTFSGLGPESGFLTPLEGGTLELDGAPIAGLTLPEAGILELYSAPIGGLTLREGGTLEFNGHPIVGLQTPNGTVLTSAPEPSTFWIECRGRHAARSILEQPPQEVRQTIL